MQNGWPDGYAALVKLYACGKVIPESWKNAYFDDSDSLVVEEIGYVTKDDILTMPRNYAVFRQREARLKKELSKLKSKCEKDVQIELSNKTRKQS